LPEEFLNPAAHLFSLPTKHFDFLDQCLEFCSGLGGFLQSPVSFTLSCLLFLSQLWDELRGAPDPFF